MVTGPTLARPFALNGLCTSSHPHCCRLGACCHHAQPQAWTAPAHAAAAAHLPARAHDARRRHALEVGVVDTGRRAALEVGTSACDVAMALLTMATLWLHVPALKVTGHRRNRPCHTRTQPRALMCARAWGGGTLACQRFVGRRRIPSHTSVQFPSLGLELEILPVLWM